MEQVQSTKRRKRKPICVDFEEYQRRKKFLERIRKLSEDVEDPTVEFEGDIKW